MNHEKITAHEPEAELLNPDELDNDVAVINRCLRRRRLESEILEALSDDNTIQMLEKLIAAGICRDEKEVIVHSIQTLFVAVFPESLRHIEVMP